jgi:hypothetical protein
MPILIYTRIMGVFAENDTSASTRTTTVRKEYDKPTGGSGRATLPLGMPGMPSVCPNR